jgi:hypothetical protein
MSSVRSVLTNNITGFSVRSARRLNTTLVIFGRVLKLDGGQSYDRSSEYTAVAAGATNNRVLLY